MKYFVLNAGIDIDALGGITERDLDQIFPEFKVIGLKIKFRKNIIEWRKSKVGKGAYFEYCPQ